MWTIKDLMERFGLSEKQVRLRLTALAPLLDGHLRTGKQNALLVDDYAIQLFDRLLQIESRGITTKDAAKQVASELGKPQEGRDSVQGQAQADEGQTTGTLREEPWLLLVEELQERIKSLEQDKAYLQRQVERLLEQLREKDAQLQTMLPAAAAAEQGRKRWWRFWK